MRFWDSSALVALLVEEPDSALRARQLTEDPVIAVWWATEVECESAIQRRLREGTLARAGARLAQERLADLARTWHEVVPTPAVRRLALRILRTHPLRAVDAMKLGAALALTDAGLADLAFISADQRLSEAAEIENLRILE
jgi:hypothetical protein